MNGEWVTGLILAGGQGRRMGGVDKGLKTFQGKPLVQHVIERLRPQVAALLINANQNLDVYARFGHPVFADDIGGFAGPLAGLQAGLTRAQTPLLATAPCDSPLLPADLVDRLYGALVSKAAQLAVAMTGDQPHPVFTLCRREVLHSLDLYLAGGGRKIDAWYASLDVVEVPFDDEAEAFANINTLEELDVFGKGNPQHELDPAGSQLPRRLRS